MTAMQAVPTVKAAINPNMAVERCEFRIDFWKNAESPWQTSRLKKGSF